MTGTNPAYKWKLKLPSIQKLTTPKMSSLERSVDESEQEYEARICLVAEQSLKEIELEISRLESVIKSSSESLEKTKKDFEITKQLLHYAKESRSNPYPRPINLKEIEAKLALIDSCPDESDESESLPEKETGSSTITTEKVKDFDNYNCGK